VNVRDIVRLRAGGRCERCGVSLLNVPASVHHRRPRGMGGAKNLDTVANLVVLCGSGTTGCHGWVESHRAEAIAQGWLVPRREARTPEEVPVEVYGQLFRVSTVLEPWEATA
jgi:hypothetical protein